MAGGGALSLGRDIAIDLGTANTLVYVKGEGVVLNEPSSVAVDSRTGELVAVGFEAKRMWGRAPQNIRLVRPLQDGVIADFDVCEKMLRYFIQQVHTSRWNKPRMIICVPSEITGVERRAVQEAAEFAGARRPVYIIEEPMAAAIGAGLPVHLPSANLIVDIGGGIVDQHHVALGEPGAAPDFVLHDDPRDRRDGVAPEHFLHRMLNLAGVVAEVLLQDMIACEIADDEGHGIGDGVEPGEEQQLRIIQRQLVGDRFAVDFQVEQVADQIILALDTAGVDDLGEHRGRPGKGLDPFRRVGGGDGDRRAIAEFAELGCVEPHDVHEDQHR